MDKPPQLSWIFGLDIGSNSVGWAALKVEPDGSGGWAVSGLLDGGSRVFEISMDQEGDFERGRGETLSKNRRDARSARRRLERTGRRQEKLFRLLAEAGLLPNDEAQPTPLGGSSASKRKLRDRKPRARKASTASSS